MLSMSYLKQALSAPELHFKRLGQAKPVYYNGAIAIGRTYSAIETEIEWNNRHYVLYIPNKRELIEHIAHLENISQERSRGPLIENRILYDEFIEFDAMGNKRYHDIILQEKPSGLMLKEAVSRYKIADLRTAINRMKSRLDAIGFRHNNLRPSNILICDSGVARPLRYWYAEWEVFSNNDISLLTEYLDKYDSAEHDLVKLPLFPSENEDESTHIKEHEGIRLCYKCGRYGFVDCDGRQITPYIYTWAKDFNEGRAIVSKNNKVGVINNKGQKVISTIYENIDFDIETGLFTAKRDKYGYIFNYDGKRLRKWKIKEDSDK